MMLSKILILFCLLIGITSGCASFKKDTAALGSFNVPSVETVKKSDKKSMIIEIIKTFHSFSPKDDPANDCLDTAIITQPRYQSKKTIQKSPRPISAPGTDGLAPAGAWDWSASARSWPAERQPPPPEAPRSTHARRANALGRNSASSLRDEC